MDRDNVGVNHISSAADVIRGFVENTDRQIAAMRAALRQADAGDFALGKDVAALSRKWKVSAD